MTPFDPRSRTAQLESEAKALRRRLDALLDELDRRRGRAARTAALVGRYSLPFLLAAAVLAAGVYGLGRWRPARVRWSALKTRTLPRVRSLLPS